LQGLSSRFLEFWSDGEPKTPPALHWKNVSNPLLEERRKMKNGRTLDSRSGWEQGGDAGPVVVIGKPDESLLIKMVRWMDDDHQMPPKKLGPQQRHRAPPH